MSLSNQQGALHPGILNSLQNKHEENHDFDFRRSWK